MERVKDADVVVFVGGVSPNLEGDAKSTATSIYWLFYYAGSSLIGSLTGIVFTRYGWNLFVELLLVLTVMALVVALIPVAHVWYSRFRVQVARN